MRVRVALVDLNSILVFDRGFTIFAPLEILIAALEVLLFPYVRIVRTTQYRHGQEKEKDSIFRTAGATHGLFVSVAGKNVHVYFLTSRSKTAIHWPQP